MDSPLLAFQSAPNLTDMALLFVLVIGGAFALISLIVSFYRFRLITGELQPVDATGHMAAALPAMTETATNRFQVDALRRLGLRGKPAPFTAFYLGCTPPEGHGGVMPGMQEALLEATRAHMRTTDSLHKLDDGRLGLFADGCPREHALTAARRLREGLARTQIKTPAWTGYPEVRVAVVTFPEMGSTLADLLDGLEKAYEEAGSTPDRVVLAAPPVDPEDELDEADGDDPAVQSTAEEEEPEEVIDTSLVDPLTGVIRADRIGSAMQKYLATRRRSSKPAALLYLAPDHIEQYVKQYGPGACDALLQAFGDLLQHATRLSDVPGRFEKNTFLVMLACPLPEGLQVARRLCIAMRARSVSHQGRTFRMTLSAGVAAHPEHGRTPRDLYETAFVALENAQARGGNMALAYEHGMRREQRQRDTAIDRF